MANASGIITAAERSTSTAELRTLPEISSLTGAPVASEVPRSPVSSPPSQSK